MDSCQTFQQLTYPVHEWQSQPSRAKQLLSNTFQATMNQASYKQLFQCLTLILKSVSVITKALHVRLGSKPLVSMASPNISRTNSFSSFESDYELFKHENLDHDSGSIGISSTMATNSSMYRQLFCVQKGL